jgi:TonB family protein
MARDYHLLTHDLLTCSWLDRILRLRRRRLPLLGLCLACLSAPVLLSQELPRKVVARTLPAVPPMARKIHLVGKVKLELTVAPNGSVASAKMVGGSPVFEQTAIAAAKQWKFERSENETKEMIVMDFQIN